MFPSRIPPSNVVKNTVKAAITGKRISATLAALSVVFATFIIYYFSASLGFVLGDNFFWIIVIINILGGLLVLAPLSLGVVRYFWRFTAEADDGPAEVFYYFSSFIRYKRPIKLTLIILLRGGFIVLACMLPFAVINIISNTWIYQFLGTEIPLWAAGLELLKEFLKFSGICLSCAFLLKYYLTPAIAVMDDDLLLMEAVHISTMVARKSAGSFLSLIASLVGWILLSFLGIPLIYTAPLFFGCYAIHSRYALVNYNLILDFYKKEGYQGF